MNRETALFLNSLNERFYREVHESFSSTRSGAWPGWQRAMTHVLGAQSGPSKPIRVLDVACGNMRFESFLDEHFEALPFEAHCVDNCAELAVPSLAYVFTQLDIVDRLISWSGKDLAACFSEANYDLAACFGFFHHVPTQKARLDLLQCLLRALKPGGIAVVSFWRFMENDRLSSKALASHLVFTEMLKAQGFDAGQLESGDYLLGWQDREDVCRYCHHFTSEEVSFLLAQLDEVAECVDRYYEDGRDGMTNEYLVLKRREISEICS